MMANICPQCDGLPIFPNNPCMTCGTWGQAAPVASPRDPSLQPLDDYLQAKALAEHPVASQAPAPKRPERKNAIHSPLEAEAYMDYLEGQNAELTRKGEELCCVLGNLLIHLHELGLRYVDQDKFRYRNERAERAESRLQFLEGQP